MDGRRPSSAHIARGIVARISAGDRATQNRRNAASHPSGKAASSDEAGRNVRARAATDAETWHPPCSPVAAAG
jgi:hypothetical protein